MSEFVPGNQSRLRVAHRYLWETRWTYRLSGWVAPLAVVVAIAAGAGQLLRPRPIPLPPPAVPVAASEPSMPVPTASAAGPTAPAPAPVVDNKSLRNEAVTDPTALAMLRRRADSGNASAQFYLATLYDPLLTSLQFKKDVTVALQWYRKAADQGDSAAERNLGDLYTAGPGIGRNYTEALRWLKEPLIRFCSTRLRNMI